MASRTLATDLDGHGISRIRNIPDPLDDGELCNLRTARLMFDQAMDAIRGLNWKDDCVVGFAGSIDVLSPPISEDTVALQNGDRVLLLGQANPTQNGIYVWNDRTLQRSVDANHGDLLQAAVVTVADGSLRGQTFRQSSRNPVLGLSAIVWTPFLTGVVPASTTQAGILRLATLDAAIAGLSPDTAITPLTLHQALASILVGAGGNGMAVTVGDGVMSDFIIEHPYRTVDLMVSARRIVNGEQVQVAAQMPSIDQVVVSFASPPPADSFRILILPV